MKIVKLLTLVVAFFFGVTNADAQNVNIPDPNFKYALVSNPFVNTNGDGEIQVSEAEAYTGILNVRGYDIVWLTGIEAFTGLTGLYIDNNYIDSFDLSHNTALTILTCAYNAYTLTTIDVSSNTALITLICDNNNQLRDLDFSHNTSLTYLDCSQNLLSILNVANGNNTNFTTFNATSNYSSPMCITVDNVAWSTANWTVVGHNISGWASFSLNCACVPILNIPDANFKAALVANAAINTNGDGEIQVCEAQAYTGFIDVSYHSIADLTGIEAFTALTGLYCDHNALNSLDVSHNTALTDLNSSSNYLSTIDVSHNTALVTFLCASDVLSNLDVSNNISLDYLDCASNDLISIDVSNNTVLTTFYCENDLFHSLDLSHNISLAHLDCSGNYLNSLDVSNNTALTDLLCYNNTISSLDVSQNTALIDLECYINSLSSLDISHNTNLVEFHCNDNYISSLDLSHCSDLVSIDCHNNSLSNLNIANGSNINNSLNFYAINNPFLSCIQVDDVTWATANWTVGDGNIDAGASFSLNCAPCTTFTPLIIANGQTTFCDGGNVTLDVGVYSSYSWSNGGTGEAITVSASGTYTVSVVDNNGCSGTASYVVTVNPCIQTAYITNNADNTVSVINVATNSVTATIPVGAAPYGVAVSHDGRKVYITNENDNTVSVINAASNTVSATITVGAYPAGVSVSPDGSKVYVNNANDATVSVINTATNTVTATVPVGNLPLGISVSTDGSKVYVANYNDNTVSVIDAATNTVSATIAVGFFPAGVAVSPDGSKVYTANVDDNTVSVINTNDNTVSASISVGTGPWGICVSPDGTRVYVAIIGDGKVSVINTINNTVSTSITVGTGPYGLSISPDGTKLYVANLDGGTGNTVSIINTGTNTVSATVTVGNAPIAFGNFISTYTATPCTHIVNIPDANFKAALVGNSAINTNGDGEIQYCEAEAYTGIMDVTGDGIYDLTGIEAFTALGTLYCYNNYLSSLDVSLNTALTSLECGYNSLSSLDVSHNTALTILECSNNSLSSLDVSHNTALNALRCDDNSLSSLDVSQNTALTALYCNNNSLNTLNVNNNTALTQLLCYSNTLSILDVSHNTALYDLYCENNTLSSLNVANGNNMNFNSFYATNNPSLSCIQVDNVAYSTATWTVSNGNIDATESFSLNCAPCSPLTPVITANGPTTFCPEGSVTLDAGAYSTYSWSTGETTQTIVATTNTIYTVTVTDVNGCSGSASQDVTVINQIPSVNITGNTSICQGQSATLNAAASGAIFFVWSDGETTQTIDVSTAGTYAVTATNVYGCSDNTSVDVNVNANPAPSIATNGPITFCLGGSVTLDAGAYSTYSWSTGETTQTIVATSNTIYTVTVTDVNGCSGSASQDVTVINQIPSVNITGNTSICQGQSATLNAAASGAIFFVWSDGETTHTIDVTTTGTYAVTVTNVYGCTGSASIGVTVNILPTPTITANGPPSFCLGGSVMLDAGAFSTYLWSNGATTETITVVSTNTFRVTVTNSFGCTGTASQGVTVTPTITGVTITGPTTACGGGNATITTGTYNSYLWSNGATTQSINVTATGIYFVTVSNGGNCTAVTHQSVTILTSPVPNILSSNLANLCGNGNATLTVGATFASYTWSTGSVTQGITINSGGTYAVTVVSSNGCFGMASTTVSSGCNIPAFPAIPTTSIAATSAMANWIQPTCFYGYIIRISKHNLNVWTSHTITPNTHYTFSQLTHNTIYDWQIQTNCNASGTINSGFSASQTFTTLARLENSESDNPTTSFNVYPNPAKDNLTVVFSSDKEQTYNLRLIDITGRVIINQEYTSVIGENQYELNLSAIAKGLYLVLLQNGDSVLQSKIVLQ